MQNKILLLSTVLLFIIAFSILKAQNALIINEKTGTQTSFSINSLRKLTFPTGSILVNKTDGSTSNFALGAIRSLNFSDIIISISQIDIGGRGKLTLYPNPVIDQLHIAYNTHIVGSVFLKITDLQGRIMHQQTISSQMGTNQIIILVTELRGGLYLFHLQNGNSVESIKFLKN
jgi:hypothetical protein